MTYSNQSTSSFDSIELTPISTVKPDTTLSLIIPKEDLLRIDKLQFSYSGSLIRKRKRNKRLLKKLNHVFEQENEHESILNVTLIRDNDSFHQQMMTNLNDDCVPEIKTNEAKRLYRIEYSSLSGTLTAEQDMMSLYLTEVEEEEEEGQSQNWISKLKSRVIQLLESKSKSINFNDDVEENRSSSNTSSSLYIHENLGLSNLQKIIHKQNSNTSSNRIFSTTKELLNGINNQHLEEFTKDDDLAGALLYIINQNEEDQKPLNKSTREAKSFGILTKSRLNEESSNDGDDEFSDV